MARRYKSRQLLPFSGRIYVKIRISDYNGNWSIQEGVSFQGNVERSFKIGLHEALLNALYKHFYKYGRPILKSDDVSLSDFIKRYDLKDYYIMYITEEGRYSYKTRNYKGKRYLEIRRKGKYYKRNRFSPQSTRKVDKMIQGMI